jgi:ACS family D-galactonate transporter-like MFS transporter
MKNDRVTTVSLTVLCQSFQALSIGGIALFLPLIRKDLGLNFAQGGSLAAATTLVYALMQIPAGHLSDRFSPKRLFIIGVLGSTVLSLTFGLVTEYWLALVNQTLSGFFRALLFTPGMALLTGWFPPNRRATATGLYLVGGMSGSVVFSIIGPWIVAVSDWRTAFVSVAALGILCSLVLLKFGKESPTQPARRRGGSILEAFQLFRYRFMWLCGSIQFVRFATVMSISFWLPSLLINERGIPVHYAGYIVAAQAILIAPSNVLGGYISDRLKNPILVIAVSLIVLGVTATLMVSVNNLALLIAMVAVNAVFLQMYFGPLFSIPVEILGAQKAGITTGFSNFFANVGAFCITYLLGFIKDSTGGFRYGFYSITALCMIGFILTMILSWVRRKAAASAGS